MNTAWLLTKALYNCQTPTQWQLCHSHLALMWWSRPPSLRSPATRYIYRDKLNKSKRTVLVPKYHTEIDFNSFMGRANVSCSTVHGICVWYILSSISLPMKHTNDTLATFLAHDIHRCATFTANISHIYGVWRLGHVMAWCRQAASHYLSQCLPISMSSYGVTMPQWVKVISGTVGHEAAVRTMDN